ncbi:FmdB family zinc ribbon protein [Marinagarivorans algicola]|uniref:FmdB family zinc ribbon protein n=1 Tax=Marinagarivorans algicola TaxID=1513270 RepID=UPI0006B4BD38|nr:zinc ribbon domain-containing protein [Marinagarivorans algicola]
MPIYEYRCTECGHELEALQKMSDAPLIDCPECSNPSLSKKVSAAGFRLSGSGWYETDFKSGSKKNLAGDKTAPKAEKKTDAKPKAASSSS